MERLPSRPLYDPFIVRPLLARRERTQFSWAFPINAPELRFLAGVLADMKCEKMEIMDSGESSVQGACTWKMLSEGELFDLFLCEITSSWKKETKSAWTDSCPVL